MISSGASASLGLAAAATWGGSDFAGGYGARRAPAMLIVAAGHVTSFLVLAVVCCALRIGLPAGHDLLLASIAGFEGSLALAVFYRALAMGTMGLTAALTGLLTALVPVLFSLASDGLPGPLTAAGLLAGLGAIWLITQTPAHKSPATPVKALLLGGLAGIGFGLQLTLFKFAGRGSLLWTMTAARAAGALAILLVVAARPPQRPWRGFWLAGIVAGMLDTAGNLFYLRATQIGRLDVAAVVSSLYPAGTILLAGLVLRERPTRFQLAGMVLALGAVLLLSA